MRAAKKSKLPIAAINRALKGKTLVLASNRGPVEFVDEGGKLRVKRGAGGLITALHSVLAHTQALWVASAMSKEDRVAAKQSSLIGVPPEKPQYRVRLLDIPPKTYDLYYNEISNRVLWFLHHYLFDTMKQPVFDAPTKHAWHQGYVPVNKLFANAIADVTSEVARPIVMLQDYHMYMVPTFLRQLKPDAVLFHFLHVPWCTPDYLKLLPAEMRLAILDSLLTNDIIGMHSWKYVSNFLKCCDEFLDCRIDERLSRVYVGDRAVAVKAYPISISVDDLIESAESDQVHAHEPWLKELTNSSKLIARIDRADPSKNILRGFDAFEMLLNRYPQFRRRVKFLVCAYPTRQNLAEYRQLRQDIGSRVDQINAMCGDSTWQPIELCDDDNYHRSLAVMKGYDVLLTNPTYDGMNLVVKEAAILNETDGVIVLSENAGAYEELSDGALGVNPFDVSETMQRLYQALTMPQAERHRRAERLAEIVKRNDVVKWLHHQLTDIAEATSAPATGKVSSRH